jgi:hypothetical protein
MNMITLITHSSGRGGENDQQNAWKINKYFCSSQCPELRDESVTKPGH